MSVARGAIVPCLRLEQAERRAAAADAAEKENQQHANRFAGADTSAARSARPPTPRRTKPHARTHARRRHEAVQQIYEKMKGHVDESMTCV